MPKFSKDFDDIAGWLQDRIRNEYTKRIARLHDLYPDATLSQLRGHAKKKEKPLSKTLKKAINRRGWSALSASEKEIREKALEVVSIARRDKIPLNEASRRVGISPKTVRRHTKAFKKVDGRWVVKKSDKIPRTWKIYENGDIRSIEVTDSRHATTISKYHHAIAEFLDTRDESLLKPFKRKRVKDAQGRWHTLETDPQAIYEIFERYPETEFYEVYNYD